MNQTTDNYREVVEYINGWKVTNVYPIFTQEEKEEREKDRLIRLYYIFTKDDNA